jgi:DNA-binding PadR family transcriptional regulator
MPLEHAILGFLDYRPMTGYDLKKYIDQSVAHFWSATQSHIYKALEKLEAQGFAESHVVPQEGRPNRKEYRITKTGRAEMNRWLAAPLPPAPVREAWMIQLFFAHPLSDKQIAHLLSVRRETLGRTRDELLRVQAETRARPTDGPPQIKRIQALWLLTLDYGIHYYESELAWLERTIQAVPSLPAMPGPKGRN